MSNKVDRIDVLKDDLIKEKEDRKILEGNFKDESVKCKRYQAEIVKMQQELEKYRLKENKNNVSNIMNMEESVMMQSDIY